MYATIYSNAWYFQKASDANGYGGMAYYTSETCGYKNVNGTFSGCTTDYAQSEIKYVVDAWKTKQAPIATEARLITIDEVSNLGYEWKQTCPTCDEDWVKTDDVPTWLYNSNYWYWTMSHYHYNDSTSFVWYVDNDGSFRSMHNGNNRGYVYNYNGVVRPVIILPKSAL